MVLFHIGRPFMATGELMSFHETFDSFSDCEGRLERRYNVGYLSGEHYSCTNATKEIYKV